MLRFFSVYLENAEGFYLLSFSLSEALAILKGKILELVEKIVAWLSYTYVHIEREFLRGKYT